MTSNPTMQMYGQQGPPFEIVPLDPSRLRPSTAGEIGVIKDEIERCHMEIARWTKSLEMLTEALVKAESGEPCVL